MMLYGIGKNTYQTSVVDEPLGKEIENLAVLDKQPAATTQPPDGQTKFNLMALYGIG